MHNKPPIFKVCAVVSFDVCTYQQSHWYSQESEHLQPPGVPSCPSVISPSVPALHLPSPRQPDLLPVPIHLFACSRILYKWNHRVGGLTI